MSSLAGMSAQERQPYLLEAAARLGLSPIVVEKDFWVCWLLGRVFTHVKLRHELVFKGGTSLSKVYHAIHRFSEDIDLSISPESLGAPESVLESELPATRLASSTAAGRATKKLAPAPCGSCRRENGEETSKAITGAWRPCSSAPRAPSPTCSRCWPRRSGRSTADD
ncbi:MAG TPA: nucleotidyl transferase AbiEii/AbiGii toxin family protein [Thermoanaerobaculia bacterium]|nr:nucleotidyl transferase AbiEii/AbiGii toxin family protein [Thermoanaerobaculia bacterium]